MSDKDEGVLLVLPLEQDDQTDQGYKFPFPLMVPSMGAAQVALKVNRAVATVIVHQLRESGFGDLLQESTQSSFTKRIDQPNQPNSVSSGTKQLDCVDTLIHSMMAPADKGIGGVVSSQKEYQRKQPMQQLDKKQISQQYEDRQDSQGSGKQLLFSDYGEQNLHAGSGNSSGFGNLVQKQQVNSNLSNGKEYLVNSLDVGSSGNQIKSNFYRQIKQNPVSDSVGSSTDIFSEEFSSQFRYNGCQFQARKTGQNNFSNCSKQFPSSNTKCQWSNSSFLYNSQIDSDDGWGQQGWNCNNDQFQKHNRQATDVDNAIQFCGKYQNSANSDVNFNIRANNINLKCQPILENEPSVFNDRKYENNCDDLGQKNLNTTYHYAKDDSGENMLRQKTQNQPASLQRNQIECKGQNQGWHQLEGQSSSQSSQSVKNQKYDPFEQSPELVEPHIDINDLLPPLASAVNKSSIQNQVLEDTWPSDSEVINDSGSLMEGDYSWMQIQQQPYVQKKEEEEEEKFTLPRRSSRGNYAGSRAIKEEMQFFVKRSKVKEEDYKFGLRFHEELYQDYFSVGNKAIKDLGGQKFWDCISTLLQYFDKHGSVPPQTWEALSLVSKEMNSQVTESITKLTLNPDVTILSHKYRIQQIKQAVQRYSKNVTALDLTGAAPELNEPMLLEFIKCDAGSQDDECDGIQRRHALTWLCLKGSFRLQNRHVQTWAGQLNMLNYLDLSGCWQITHDGFQQLMNQGVHPRTLIFQESYLGGPSLQVLSVNKRLEELDLSYPRKLKDSDLGYLHKLTTLKILRVNCVNRQQFHPACLEPLTTLSNLQVLDLPATEGNQDQDDIISEMYVQNLVPLLCALKNLEELRVGQWCNQVPVSVTQRLRKLLVDPKSSVNLDLRSPGSFVKLEYVEFQIPQPGAGVQQLQDAEQIQMGQLSNLKVVRVVNNRKVNLLWQDLLLILQSAPKLEEVHVDRCVLIGPQPTDYSISTVSKLSLVDINTHMTSLQVFYDLFPNLTSLYLQDITAPEGLIDTLPNKLQNLDMKFVQNVDQFRILNLRGRRPYITYDFRKQEVKKNSAPTVRRQLENLVVEQMGNYLDGDYLTEILQSFHFGPKEDMRINGIMKYLGAHMSFDKYSTCAGGRYDTTRWMTYDNQIIYPTTHSDASHGMEYEEKRLFQARIGYISFLRGYLKKPKDRLEYTAVFRN